jgi:DNA-binding PadR family transcriptional regulator
MRLPPGTLYRSIKRLRDEGLIDASPERPAADDDDERRRYYRITEAGHDVAAAEARRLAEIVGLARSRHLLEEHDLV